MIVLGKIEPQGKGDCEGTERSCSMKQAFKVCFMEEVRGEECLEWGREVSLVDMKGSRNRLCKDPKTGVFLGLRKV
jgi:hypothetical protein